MGPVFGIKGRGRRRVVPGPTHGGDKPAFHRGPAQFHGAQPTLRNADNHLNKGNILDIDEDSIFWPRVMDMNDRSLRSITIGQGAKVNGPTRKDRHHRCE